MSIKGKKATHMFVDEFNRIKKVELTEPTPFSEAVKLSPNQFWKEVENQLSTALGCSVEVSIVTKDEENENQE